MPIRLESEEGTLNLRYCYQKHSIVRGVIAILLALAVSMGGVVFTPLFAMTSSGAGVLEKDTSAPVIQLKASTPFQVEVSVVDTGSGVKELVINDKKLMGARAQSTSIQLFANDKDEFFYLQATDYANNKSDVAIIVNPHFIGETKPMLHTILKSALHNKQEQVYSRKRYIYPIASAESDTETRLYFEINSDKQKDIIAKQQSDENKLKLKSFTRYQTYFVKPKTVTETVTTVTTSNDYNTVLSKLAPTYHYNKVGYQGTLKLDYNNLHTEVNSLESSYYTLYEERVYPGLQRRDESQIPQTVTSNGVIYTLSNISWSEVTDMDNEDALTTYTARVTYVYGATSTTTADYKTIAKYTGIVASLGEKNMVYEMVFDKQAPEAEEDDEVGVSSSNNNIIVSENEDAALAKPTNQDTETKYVKAVDTHRTDSDNIGEWVLLVFLWLVALGMVIILVAFIMLFNKIKKGE